MSKGLKITLWVVAVLVILFLIAIWYGKNVWDKITFKPYFISADLKGLSLSDVPAILGGEDRKVTATLGMQIKNESNVSFPISGLKAKLYYNGEIIAETSDALKNASFISEANSEDVTPPIIDTITVILNQAGGKLLVDKISGKKPEIKYTVDVNVFGIPISKIYPIESSFTW